MHKCAHRHTSTPKPAPTPAPKPTRRHTPTLHSHRHLHLLLLHILHLPTYLQTGRQTNCSTLQDITVHRTCRHIHMQNHIIVSMLCFREIRYFATAKKGLCRGCRDCCTSSATWKPLANKKLSCRPTDYIPMAETSHGHGSRISLGCQGLGIRVPNMLLPLHYPEQVTQNINPSRRLRFCR